MALASFKLSGGHAVKLGRIIPAVMPKCVRFGDYFAPSHDFYTRMLPASIDYSVKAQRSLRTMLGNDRWGNCVIVGKLHQAGLWTGNDSDSGGEVMPTENEAVTQYKAICGPGDRGCYIASVLDHQTRHGLIAGGKLHKLDGYVSVEAGNTDLVKAAIFLFGSVTLGINVPRDWMNVGDGGIWDLSGESSVGGHDVAAVGYDGRGVQVSTWGGFRTITWNAMRTNRIVDECYASLAPSWYNADSLMPAGVNVTALRTALAALAAGEDPIVPDPVDPVDPVDPGPVPSWIPAFAVDLAVKPSTDDYGAGWKITGTIGPARNERGPAGAFDWSRIWEILQVIIPLVIDWMSRGMTPAEVKRKLMAMFPR